MPTLTITVTMDTDDEIDDSMAILESQVAEALGFLGDVQTCDVCIDDDRPRDPDDEASLDDLDDQLTAWFEAGGVEFDEDEN